MLHQRLGCTDRQATLEVQHGGARRRTRRQHLGQAAQPAARRRRYVDHRQLRSRSESDLLGRCAGETVDARQPGDGKYRQRPLYELDPGAESRRLESSRGITSTCQANRSISTKCSSACWSTPADRRLVFTIGKAGVLWKLDRKTGKFLAHKETVFQNVFDRIDPQTGEVHYRNEIVEQKKQEWVQACPSTEGGHNWQAMSYHPGTNQLIIPLSQSCMEMSGPQRGFQGRLRRHGGGPALLRNARDERQRRQAGGLSMSRP